MKKIAILSSIFLLVSNSCSRDASIYEDYSVDAQKCITVIAEDLVFGNGTRTSYIQNEDQQGYSFSWTEGDALGIFPESGHQTDFPISNGYGTNTAVFDGGKWALRPNESYAAYYPLIHDFDLDPTAIPIDYTGQVQNGNGSTAHLSAYDYMASTFTEVDAKGNVNFHLQHLGCLVQFKFSMQQADTYSALEVTTDDAEPCFITSAKYDLADNNHTLKDIQTAGKVTIVLNNVSTTAANKDISITAMFAPVNLTGKTLSLTLKGSNDKNYNFEVDGQDFSKGKTVNNSTANVNVIPYTTLHANDEQTLTMSKAVDGLMYSVNGGAWATLGTNTVTFGGGNGDLRLRGSNRYGTALSETNYSQIVFGTEENVECSGDIRTIADYASYLTEDTSDDKFCHLFENCTSLVSAPELPATSLASECYISMFSGCSSMTTAPELPATSLKAHCYQSMFQACTSLIVAPELPATDLVENCYAQMFKGCANLASVKMLATYIYPSGCLDQWLSGVSSTGRFVKNSAATWNVTGNSGIPDDWSIIYGDGLLNGHEYIDLGLKDSNGNPLYWATCNLGAINPEDTGWYFAWGEIIGYSYPNDEGRTFSWADYSKTLCGGTYNSLKKYCIDSDYGIVDNKTVLDLEDDAARINWGGAWRIPTKEEQDLLRTNCDWTWVNNGYKVSNKNDNKKFIFLPAAGEFSITSVSSVNSLGCYWSSTSKNEYYPNHASTLFFRSNYTQKGSESRNMGCTIRPVCILIE